MKKKFQSLEDISCQTTKFALILDVVQVNSFTSTVFFRPNCVIKMSSCLQCFTSSFFFIYVNKHLK